VSDGNARHGSSALVMEMTKAIEQEYHWTPNGTGVGYIFKGPARVTRIPLPRMLLYFLSYLAFFWTGSRSGLFRCSLGLNPPV
jgi:hypothetical protein